MHFVQVCEWEINFFAATDLLDELNKKTRGLAHHYSVFTFVCGNWRDASKESGKTRI